MATYEAPIEFDLLSIPNQGGPVSQSTIPEHLQSFIRAVRNSTRTAPNVVLIGESRDAETLRGMTTIERNDFVERFIACTGIPVEHHGGTAFYEPGSDVVKMPFPERFTVPEEYYATKLHGCPL